MKKVMICNSCEGRLDTRDKYQMKEGYHDPFCKNLLGLKKWAKRFQG